MNAATPTIRLALVHAALTFLVSTDTLTTRAESFDTIAYQLVEGSTYQEGCFEPCMCPLLQEQAMTGTFDVVFHPFAGPIWTVGVERVTWSIPTLGKEIQGQGIYRRAGDQQQFSLELQINGEPPRVFDSGWVPGGNSYPTIDITLSMNGLFCYDIALRVLAKPVSETPRLDVEDTLLSWTSVSGVATYDVVCGDLMELRENGGDFSTAVDACLVDNLPENVLPFDIPGGGLWFLVRPHGGSWDSGGGSQAGSRDEEIASSVVACP